MAASASRSASNRRNALPRFSSIGSASSRAIDVQYARSFSLSGGSGSADSSSLSSGGNRDSTIAIAPTTAGECSARSPSWGHVSSLSTASKRITADSSVLPYKSTGSPIRPRSSSGSSSVKGGARSSSCSMTAQPLPYDGAEATTHILASG